MTHTQPKPAMPPVRVSKIDIALDKLFKRGVFTDGAARAQTVQSAHSEVVFTSARRRAGFAPTHRP